ncbi:transposase [Streptomyces jeddahensis]|uniref:Transposase n=1 Tax=Streptomyces jeddahensis TaxID=1716141 RepID=A0A177HZU9_9ACTN|nr:transposase [Streptomyces jeddahensis]OAH16217.1 transposase [Streptomyces jeddahensis]
MSKQSNKSKQYTAEFKRDAVALALASDKMPTEAARDLGVSAGGVCNWVNQAKTHQGQGPAGALLKKPRPSSRSRR